MRSQISRRSFLKLLALLPLLKVEVPHFIGKAKNMPQNPERPNILILVFDALSAKHMSVYGYNRETTPNLARFAKRATVYHAHYAGGNHTSPGVASILTGTYPWSHCGFHIHGTVAESYKEKNLFSVFSAGTCHRIAYSHNLLVTSLLHQFREDVDVFKKTRDLCLIDDQFSDQVFPNDFNVAFWSESHLFREGKSPPSSLFLSLFNRMWRFTHKKKLMKEYGSLFPRGLPHLHSLFFILEHAIDWIEVELSRSPQPFLAYFHLLPPHEPYLPRREFLGLFDGGWTPMAKASHFFSEGHSDEFLNQQRREYDEYIAYADAEFGRLYDFMAQIGMLDNTYGVFTSDHGEMFERGIRGHITPTLYEPVIRVPLLISKPGQRRRKDVYTPTSCVDLLPTLLHVTGQIIPDWCEGKILPTFGGKKAHSECSVFVVEAKSNPKLAPLTKGTVAMIKGQYKLIHYFGYDGYESEYELYDLANDPEEMEDLCASRKSVAADLKSELEEKLKGISQPYLVK